MTKKLLIPAMANKPLNRCYSWGTKVLLGLLYLSSISALAQHERLLKKGLFLSDPFELIDGASTTNQKIIFSAYDENSQTSLGSSSLWITDGTATGTKMLRNFGKEPDVDFLNNITLSTNFYNFNNKAFFNGSNHVDYRVNYLYVTDGTESGTFRLIDSKVAKSIYVVLNGKLYISNGTELLTSDGTKAGTKKTSISSLSEISNLLTVNQHLIIETESGIYSYHDQTQTLAFLADKTNPAVATKDYVFFVGKDGDLWKTNGTTQGTAKVINIAEGADIRVPGGLITTNKYVAFLSYTDKTKNNTSMWISDGVTTAPMKDNTGKIVSTDSTGFRPIHTKFDEKLYFQLTNLDDATLANNNYLFVFHNNTSNAKFLKNITGFEGNLYPFKPKINTKQEYLYGTPEDRFILDGDITIKGFNATTDSLITLTRILTESPTSWTKNGSNIYFNKGSDDGVAGLYVRGACAFDIKIMTPDGTHICKNNPIKLDVLTIAISKPAPFYDTRWAFEKDPLQNNPHKANKAGVYTVHVNDGICTVSASVNVTKSDSLTVSIAGNSLLCPGQSTTLSAIIEESTTLLSYQWKKGTDEISTNASTLSVKTAGSYNLLVKNSTGCQGIAQTFTVEQQPLPDVRITKSNGTDIVSGGSTTLSVPSSANQTYQWFKEAIAISGAISNTYIAKEPGKYSITVKANGCSASSEIVIVNLVLANESIIEPILVEVYPNPTDNLIKLIIAEPLKRATQVSLFNAQGTMVKRWEIKQQDTTLNLSDLPAGQYILKADINNRSTSKKIIKLQ